MILNPRPLLAILLLLTACSGNVSKTKGNDLAINQTNRSTSSFINTTYMPTGFYFLADSSKGVKMQLKGSNKVYSIAPNAFASVKNIINTKLEETRIEKGVYTDLCLTFDSKGTNDLKKGTGKLLHPKIAVVIANQLLYVVDNNANITAGVMHVALMGFSNPEMKALQNEVDHKN